MTEQVPPIPTVQHPFDADPTAFLPGVYCKCGFDVDAHANKGNATIHDGRYAMTERVPSLAECEAYGARILMAIDMGPLGRPLYAGTVRAADRRLVALFLEGLRDHQALGDWAHSSCKCGRDYHRECPDALRYWAALQDIGALYGERP